MSESGIPPNVGEIAGPQLIGHLINWALLGVLILQIYIYYLAFPRSGAYRKTLVVFILVLELAQTVMATHDIFAALATGWGTPGALDHIYWSCVDVPIMGSILSCTVQLYNAWRIYRFSGSRANAWRIYGFGSSWVMTLPVIILALLQLVAALITGAECFRIQHLSLLPIRAIKTCALWLSSSAACDVIIAGAMSYYLWGERSTNAFPRTRTLLSRLIYVFIGGGTVTATVAIFNVIVFFAAKSTDFFVPPAIILSKLYSNSLLVQFNSNVRIIGSRDDGGRDFVADLREVVNSDRVYSDSIGPVTPVAYVKPFSGLGIAPKEVDDTHRSRSNTPLEVMVTTNKSIV